MKKYLALILAVLTVLAFVTACSGTEKPEESKATSESKAVAESETEKSEASEDKSEEVSEEGFKYATDKYSGTTITILTVEADRHTYGTLQFVPNDELEGNAINEAVMERNNYILSNYGITIKTISEKYPTDRILKDVEDGNKAYDLVCDSVDRMCAKLLEGMFIPVDDYFDFEDKWWNQESIDMLSLDGANHFFVSGDCLLTDVDNIYLTLYNKKIYAENTYIQSKFGDIYKLVEDHKFTLDAFIEMCREVSEPDSDGAWSFNATYGNLSHAYGATIMVNGCGVGTVARNSQNEIESNVMSEKAVNAFEKVYELMSDKTITTRAELIIGKGTNKSTYGFAELAELFVSGRGLFYNTTVNSISTLKGGTTENGFEFGVLPIPLLDETQENYYAPINIYHSSVIGIPIFNDDTIEESAFLLNALGYYNKNLPQNVYNAYYDITLKNQGSDTEDDEKMLDIIFGSMFYDLGTIYNFGGLLSLYGSVIADDSANTLVSKYEGIQISVEQAIEDATTTYIALDD